jgi:rhodanese-related sulfurtransferase
MNTLRLFLLLSLFVLMTACNATYKNVSVQDLAKAKETNHILLDVREVDEYEAGHVADSLLIPLGELASRIGELTTHTAEISSNSDVPIYVICRSGNRSRQASDILIKAGFKDIRNVEGGILAWQEAGFAVE